MRIFVRRGIALALTSIAWFSSCEFVRADDVQIRAALTKFFIQNHAAIPLKNIGEVKSGDVLQLPEEATVVPRSQCYSFPAPSYRRLLTESLDIGSAVAAAGVAEWPAFKIAQLKEHLAGARETVTKFSFDPFSEEQPPGGLSALYSPKQDAKCAIIGRILRGEGDASGDVLVTRVFFGSMNAQASIQFSDSSIAEARIEQLGKLVPANGSLKMKVNGSSIEVQQLNSPAPQPLAVQSAVIDLDELAAIHLKLKSNSPYELALLVQSYISNTDPKGYQIIAKDVDAILRNMGFEWLSADKLYVDIFTGKHAIYPIEKASKDELDSLGSVAAAAEIAKTVRK